jgi:hypothetical protein
MTVIGDETVYFILLTPFFDPSVMYGVANTLTNLALACQHGFIEE